MTSCRLTFATACAALATIASFALSAAPASAAGTKVLLLTRTEEGTGPAAAPGEAAHVTNYVKWTALHTLCGATEEQATLGKNPSGTVKATGTGQPLENSQCFDESNFETVQGSVAVKSASAAKTGAVKLTGVLEMKVGECSYRATKLNGTQTFGEEFTETLTGTGKLFAHSAKSCAKTTPVEDMIGVSDAAGFNYTVELTS
jgi:hypothetical protein